MATALKEFPMKYPHCPASMLAITERSDIDIGYRPQCHDVWLDRDKLDQLIEKSPLESIPCATAPLRAVCHG